MKLLQFLVLDSWDLFFNIKLRARFITSFGVYLIFCGGMQSTIKEIYAAANFIHCLCPHEKFDHATSKFISEGYNFLPRYRRYQPFFHQSPKRADVRTEVVKRRVL